MRQKNQGISLTNLGSRRILRAVLSASLFFGISISGNLDFSVAASGVVTSGGCSVNVSNTDSATVTQVASYCVLKITSGNGFTWQVPQKVNSIYVIAVGGGGGGAADGGAGGGGGETRYGWETVTPSDYETVTIGAGGSGNASNAGTAGSGGQTIMSDSIATNRVVANGGAGAIGWNISGTNSSTTPSQSASGGSGGTGLTGRDGGKGGIGTYYSGKNCSTTSTLGGDGVVGFGDQVINPGYTYGSGGGGGSTVADNNTLTINGGYSGNSWPAYGSGNGAGETSAGVAINANPGASGYGDGGGGGGACHNTNRTSAGGGSGVVIVRFAPMVNFNFVDSYKAAIGSVTSLATGANGTSLATIFDTSTSSTLIAYIKLVNPKPNESLLMPTRTGLTDVDTFGETNSASSPGNFKNYLFYGSKTDINRALASLKLDATKVETSTSSTLNGSSVYIAVDTYKSNYFYNTTNHHFYILDTSTATWTTAQSRASAIGYLGNDAYLATITSDSENNYLRGITSASGYNTSDYMIGATDSASVRAYNSNDEGTWEWYRFDRSPEAGSVFWYHYSCDVPTVHTSNGVTYVDRYKFQNGTNFNIDTSTTNQCSFNNAYANKTWVNGSTTYYGVNETRTVTNGFINYSNGYNNWNNQLNGNHSGGEPNNAGGGFAENWANFYHDAPTGYSTWNDINSTTQLGSIAEIGSGVSNLTTDIPLPSTNGINIPITTLASFQAKQGNISYKYGDTTTVLVNARILNAVAPLSFSVTYSSAPNVGQLVMDTLTASLLNETVTSSSFNYGTNGINIETITATDATGYSIYETFTITVSKADTLTVTANSPTSITYSPTMTIPANGHTKTGLQGADTFTVGYTYSYTGTTCASGGTCQVGDIGPAGGYIFYVDEGTLLDSATSVSSGGHYLEAAPSSYSSPTVNWCEGITNPYTTTLGATASAVGSGAANTLIMLNAGCTGGAGYAAANATINGYSDWFLPSSNEQSLMYFYQSGIGINGSNLYWGSTETGNWIASSLVPWAGVGNQNKGQATPFWPIRAFSGGGITYLSGNPTNAGTYTITPTETFTVGSATNYKAIVNTAGTLVINKANQALLRVNNLNTLFFDQLKAVLFPIYAVGGSGTGSISFALANGPNTTCATSSGPSIVSGTVGTCFISVTKAGNVNYNSATSDTATVSFIEFLVPVFIPSAGNGGISLPYSPPTPTIDPDMVPTFSAGSFSARANTTLTITGSGYTGITEVDFDSGEIVSVTPSSDTTITLTVPNTAQSGPLILVKNRTNGSQLLARTNFVLITP